MTVVASNASQHDTVSGTARIGARNSTVRMVRQILAERGLSESLGADDDGFYFVNEDAREFGICYNALGRNRAESRLLECCRALSQRGFTLSLFLSRRTSALFVRNER
jgi:hypothetical protein